MVLTRDGWVKRVRELKDPSTTRAARGRRGDGGARRLAQEQPGASSRTSARRTSPASTTSRRRPATAIRCRSSSSSTTASGWSAALSLDPRLPAAREAARRVSRARLRAALRARAAHRGLDPRRAAATPGRGEGDEIVGVMPVRRPATSLAVVDRARPTRWCARRTRSTSSPGPGAGVTVIKVDDDDRVLALPLHRGQGRAGWSSRPRRARSSSSRRAKYEVELRAAARAARWPGRTTVKLVARAARVDAAARSAEGGPLRWRPRRRPRPASDSYNASDIQVLEGLEPVRKRPACTSAAPTPRGYHHLLWEIVDNSRRRGDQRPRRRRIEVTLAQGRQDGHRRRRRPRHPGRHASRSTRSRRSRSSSPRCTRAASSSRATTLHSGGLHGVG